MAKYIVEKKVDFIFTNHCLFSPINVKRALDKCKLKIPYVSKIHGSALNFTLAKDVKRWMPYVKEGLDGAQKVICGSTYMKARFIEVCGNTYDIQIIPCGVDTKLFSSGKRGKFSSTIVYFGHILNTKGIAELLTAYAHVKK